MTLSPVAISVEAVEKAVCSVAEEIQLLKVRSRGRVTSERRAFVELAACILGSRVTFEEALAATTRLRNASLFEKIQGGADRRVILSCVTKAVRGDGTGQSRNCARYRFWRSRSKYIADTAAQLYQQDTGLLPILSASRSQRDARMRIAAIARGIGPKQASLFLRNVGFGSELAILDTHVLGFMERLRLIRNAPTRLSSIRAYETIEGVLRQYAESLGWAMDVLDQAIWVTMRVVRRSIQ